MSTCRWSGRNGGCAALVLAGGLVALALQASAAAPIPAGLELRRDATVEAIARVLPAVVNIGTETVVEVSDPYEQMLREFWGPYYRRRPAQTQYSLGSGVIIDEAGYVLTNNHVVRRASRIWVKFADEAGGGEYEAELVGSATNTDVALLKIKAKPDQKFHAVTFAADDDLILGETVIALGNPFGLGGSVSRGILSSKSRRPASDDGPLGIEDWLQTDAPINPGSSGGPLINLNGDLIGINVAVYREGQGIGFAIPVKRVSEALGTIFSPERERLWFGARVRPAGTELTVAAVELGSPADHGGLRLGDQILAVAGKKPRGFIEFSQQLMAVGDQRDVPIEVQRGSAPLNLNVRLVREATVFNAAMIREKLGISVQEITRELAERLRLITTDGLLIAGVDRGSEAETAGIERGQILLRLNGTSPDDVIAAARLLYAKKAGDKVTVEVLFLRQSGRLIIPQRGSVDLTVR